MASNESAPPSVRRWRICSPLPFIQVTDPSRGTRPSCPDQVFQVIPRARACRLGEQVQLSIPPSGPVRSPLIKDFPVVHVPQSLRLSSLVRGTWRERRRWSRRVRVVSGKGGTGRRPSHHGYHGVLIRARRRRRLRRGMVVMLDDLGRRAARARAGERQGSGPASVVDSAIRGEGSGVGRREGGPTHAHVVAR